MLVKLHHVDLLACYQYYQKFLYERQIISDQFGFRANHCNIERVHKIVTIIKWVFEKKQYCSALFIYISQAFDKVWHYGQLNKITRLLPDNTHKLLKSYLTDRIFKDKLQDELSTTKKISASVLQGSILGSIPDLINTSDIPINPNTYTSTYADETAFISVDKNPKVASTQLQ